MPSEGGDDIDRWSECVLSLHTEAIMSFVTYVRLVASGENPSRLPLLVAARKRLVYEGDETIIDRNPAHSLEIDWDGFSLAAITKRANGRPRPGRGS